jgi:hypothetical protein
MDKFRPVGTLDIPPFEIWVYDGDRINFDDKPMDSRVALTVEKARALRDWLNKALPCEHRPFTGAKLADPFGKSDRYVNVVNECLLCGETVIQASGGADGA